METIYEGSLNIWPDYQLVKFYLAPTLLLGCIPEYIKTQLYFLRYFAIIWLITSTNCYYLRAQKYLEVATMKFFFPLKIIWLQESYVLLTTINYSRHKHGFLGIQMFCLSALMNSNCLGHLTVYESQKCHYVAWLSTDCRNICSCNLWRREIDSWPSLLAQEFVAS